MLGIIAAHHQLYAGTIGAAGLLTLFFILGAWIAVDRLLVVVPTTRRTCSARCTPSPPTRRWT